MGFWQNEKIEKLEADILRLRVKNTLLRAALKPFADMAHFHREGAFWMDTAFTVEECRKAKAALKDCDNGD